MLEFFAKRTNMTSKSITSLLPHEAILQLFIKYGIAHDNLWDARPLCVEETEAILCLAGMINKWCYSGEFVHSHLTCSEKKQHEDTHA
jgi:hypothetical protein